MIGNLAILILHDPAFRRLSDRARLRYLELVLLAGDFVAKGGGEPGVFIHGGRPMPAEDLAWCLHAPAADLSADLDELLHAGLLACEAGACPNCNGLGAIWLQFVQSGPFPAPPARSVLTYHNGWYVVDNRLYPCPACQDHTSLIQYLWEHSGLESNERAWRLDFYQGLPGKEAALTFAQDVLAALPRPTGWQIYYGGYSVGKSGLLRIDNCLVVSLCPV